MMTASIRILQCSAFWYTFIKQYRKAASHRNHSKKAMSIAVPMIETYMICTRFQVSTTFPL